MKAEDYSLRFFSLLIRFGWISFLVKCREPRINFLNPFVYHQFLAGKSW